MKSLTAASGFMVASLIISVSAQAYDIPTSAGQSVINSVANSAASGVENAMRPAAPAAAQPTAALSPAAGQGVPSGSGVTGFEGHVGDLGEKDLNQAFRSQGYSFVTDYEPSGTAGVRKATGMKGQKSVRITFQTNTGKVLSEAPGAE